MEETKLGSNWIQYSVYIVRSETVYDTVKGIWNGSDKYL